MSRIVKPIRYRSLKGYKYETLENISCQVDLPDVEGNDYAAIISGRLSVRSRYAFDGPSGPTFDTPTTMRASLFHDALCQLIEEGVLDKKYRKYADELLRTHMLEDQLSNANGNLRITGAGGQVIYQAKEMEGLRRSLYLKWGKFRANGYYAVVRAYSRVKGM